MIPHYFDVLVTGNKDIWKLFNNNTHVKTFRRNPSTLKCERLLGIVFKKKESIPPSLGTRGVIFQRHMIHSLLTTPRTRTPKSASFRIVSVRRISATVLWERKRVLKIFRLKRECCWTVERCVSDISLLILLRCFGVWSSSMRIYRGCLWTLSSFISSSARKYGPESLSKWASQVI